MEKTKNNCRVDSCNCKRTSTLQFGVNGCLIYRFRFYRNSVSGVPFLPLPFLPVAFFTVAFFYPLPFLPLPFLSVAQFTVSVFTVVVFTVVVFTVSVFPVNHRVRTVPPVSDRVRNRVSVSFSFTILYFEIKSTNCPFPSLLSPFSLPIIISITVAICLYFAMLLKGDFLTDFTPILC